MDGHTMDLITLECLLRNCYTTIYESDEWSLQMWRCLGLQLRFWTTDFNGVTQAEHIRNVFRLYSIDFSNWCLCQTVGNCNLNRSIATKLKIPHVGCASHKLNLKIEDMIKTDASLKQCVESGQKTGQCYRRLQHCRRLSKTKFAGRDSTRCWITFTRQTINCVKLLTTREVQWLWVWLRDSNQTRDVIA